MRGNNVLGIVFSNMNEELIREITDKRAMGSVPFGGRYRMIDFILSNMVNSGINKVGVITKSNYQSLMDHLGSGKAWDLSKRRNGLFILPPFGNSNGEFTNRIETLHSVIGFLENSKEDYVLLSDCDVVCNIDLKKVISSHIKRKSDITIVYSNGKVPKNIKDLLVVSLDENQKIESISIDPMTSNTYNFSFNMYLMGRELLIKIIRECFSLNKSNFKKDVLQSNVEKLNMYGYKFDGYYHIISSMSEYYNANMEMMNPQVRKELFNSQKPIYTKVRDDMPTRYGLGSKVTNSLVANGCIIEGEVENCVLFRGVKVGKGAKLSNCVIMQDSNIGNNTNLQYVIIDKDVTINNNRTLMGFETYPVYINKASVV